MKIRKLEIKGFKSFPDKTDFEFIPGITAVVGPNGCGKSNVLEAIRWVMGEQRARSLRGKKMEDVIFNGSETRKPVGMAEVRLVLSNTEGLAPSYMADYDEIMISRRLFRDGESHYEINNVSCRLADITDFFLDTGVGRNSYAIIEQGRVDMVVAAKPEDRRIFIEEAAGIARYKFRKEAALKKLEQTNQNLLRINDLITEVKRQSKTLKRQAARAERYAALSERLRELDLGLHAFRCNELEEHLQRLKIEHDDKKTILSEQEAEHVNTQVKLETSRLSALETERDFKRFTEERHKTDLELASVRNRIDSNRASISRLDDRQARLETEQEAIRAATAEAERRRLDLEADRAQVEIELKAVSNDLKTDLASVQNAEQELADQRKQFDLLKDELFHTLQDTAQQRNRRETLVKRRTDLSGRCGRAIEDIASIRRRLGTDQAERDRLTEAIATGEGALQEGSGKKEELVRERAGATQRVAGLRKEQSTAEKQSAGTKARLESLEEMQREYSGYDRSVRFLMKHQKTTENEPLPAPVAEILEVPPEFQKALTASLGERLGHVVVSSPRAGIDAAKSLADAGVGRATFIPFMPRCSSDPHEADTPEGLTRLQDVVKFREGFEHLGAYLLGRCFVVEDMTKGVEIWEANGIHVDFVTTDGEVINRYGEITGGSDDREGEEIFEKRREIAELSETVAEQEEKLETMRSSLHDQETLLEKLSRDIEATDRFVNELKVKEAHMRKDRERLDGSLAGAKRKLDILDSEALRHEKEIGKISDDLLHCEQALTALETKRREQETKKNETHAMLEELNSITREKAKRTEGLRIRLAQLQERSRSLEREHKSCIDRINQQERRSADLADEAEHNTAERTKLDSELSVGSEKEKELMLIHESLNGQVENLKVRSAELSEAVKQLEQKSTAGGRLIGEARNKIHDLQLESARLEQTLEDLTEKILERYHVNLETVPVPASRPDEREIEGLKQKLSEMGEVNPTALAESRQIEERLTFLLEQESDLKKAVESLYATINTINRTSRERFREAFDKVNEQFREMFPFLFKGGEARLELTDEKDLLETGVEIMARPPGKRIQNMDLLSGGEKALTAVALIFSIFLIKPSPFCLLDEVDAPLDDANLSRFNEMLRKLSDRTQFLVITHNKRSMQAADALYGITMEEPGTSRSVSVVFAD